MVYVPTFIVLTFFSLCSHRLSKLRPTNLLTFRSFRLTLLKTWLLCLAFHLPGSRCVFYIRDESVAVTAVVSSFPTLATELSRRAVARISSAHAGATDKRF